MSATTTQTQDTTTGAVLRAMRVTVGMSQRALAEGAACSHQHLSYVEAGTRPLTYDLSHRIARAIANHVTAA